MPLRRLIKFFIGPSPHLSREDAMRIFKRDHYRCGYCGLDGRQRFENWLMLTIDHIHPHTKGGARRMDNLVTACQPCNSLKGKRVFASFEDAKAYVLAQREGWRRVFQDQTSSK